MAGENRRGRSRKSAELATLSTPRRSSRCRKSIIDYSENVCFKKSRLSIDSVKLSPSALLKKLDTVDTDALAHCNPSASVDLKDLGNMVISTEEYEKRRENIRQQVSDPEYFDLDGRTELNTAGAVVAGAKLIIDETRATRSMCKKLKEECGVEEDEVLYQPLSYQGCATKVCQEVIENRQASVVESYVDFKKQLNFKANVLEHVVNMETKKGSKTDNRGIRVKKTYDLPPKTPANRIVVNPLSGNRIINNYALDVASCVRENKKPRRIAPIPFNINCLDDVEL